MNSANTVLAPEGVDLHSTAGEGVMDLSGEPGEFKGLDGCNGVGAGRENCDSGRDRRNAYGACSKKAAALVANSSGVEPRDCGLRGRSR